MKLTEQNYFEPAAELHYMGSTQYKRFCECEARALAMVRGDWIEAKGTALVVGSYVDAYFSGEMAKFLSENPGVFNRDGSLKSDFNQANQIIDRIERDDMFMKYLDGQKQVIMTGSIGGVPFKTKVDVLHPKKAIVDLKIMKDFQSIWKYGQRLPFVEAWGYDIQGAIYQAVEGHKLPFIIAAATKEREPDIALLSIPQERIDKCLAEIKGRVGRFVSIKKGETEPVGCGYCDYCKRNKKLTEILNYWEVGNE
jgi:hypothetical protein